MRAWAMRKLSCATRIAASVFTRSANSRSTAAAPSVASLVARTATDATALRASANATTATAALLTMLDGTKVRRDTRDTCPANRTRRPGVEGSGGALHRGAHLAQRRELALGRRLERAEGLADAQVPAGRLAHLVDADA